MKRLDVSQLLDLYCELGIDGIDGTGDDLKRVLDSLDNLANSVAGHLGVQALGVSHGLDGVLINFGPRLEGDPCPPHLERHDEEGSWGESDRLTVLICDDDTTQHVLAEAVFESEGFRVLKALSAEEAWTLFLNNSVDLVITDIVLPKEDGFSFARRVIAHGGTKGSVPIITMSGQIDNEESIEQLEIIGGVMHLAKPVAWKRLAQIGRSICNSNEPRLNYFTSQR
ncbi:MAG: response regulator [Parahaliea sp.]